MSMTKSRNRKVLIGAAAALLIVVVGVLGVMGMAKTGSRKTTLPRDLSVENLMAEAESDPAKVFQRVHEAMNRTDLTDAQRDELRRNMHNVFEAQMEKRLDEYFTADAGQRRAVLDRHLDQMQPMLRQMAERRAQWERERQNRPVQPGNAGASAGAAPAGLGMAAGGGPPGPGRRDWRNNPPTQQERKMWSESRDPDQRARRMAYFTALRQRGQERGIQMPGPFGGRP